MAVAMRNLTASVQARIRQSGITLNPAANFYYVSSTAANAGNSGKSGQDPLNPFTTIAGLIASGPALVVGDVIVVLPGHVETVSAAAGLSLGKAGVTVIGVGEGDRRPTITFGTSTAATWTIADASTTLVNLIFTNSLDQVVSPLVVSAAGFRGIDLEWQDSATNVEFVNGLLTTAGAARFELIRPRYFGQTGGSHNARAFNLVGVVHGRITDMDFFGKASTAVVNFTTTLSSDIVVTGRVFNSGTTNSTKNVVDTIGSSVWASVIVDVTAGGATVNAGSGGSGSTVGGIVSFVKPDITAVGSSGAWTTANSPITLGNATGQIRIRIWGYSTAALTSTGATGTLALGVSGGTGAFIPATTINATNFPAASSNVPWTGATATVQAILQTNSSAWFLMGTGAVILTIATNNMTAGGMNLFAEWQPVLPGSTFAWVTP